MPYLSSGGKNGENNYPVSLQIDNTQTMGGETTTGGARNNMAIKGGAGLSTTQNDLSSILDSAAATHIVPGTNSSSTDIVQFPPCPKAATGNSATDDYSCT